MVSGISEAASLSVERTESQYVCPECGRSYEKADSLRSHMRRIHNARLKTDVRSRNFVCLDCNRAYLTQASFDDHQRRHHGIYKRGKQSKPRRITVDKKPEPNYADPVEVATQIVEQVGQLKIDAHTLKLENAELKQKIVDLEIQLQREQAAKAATFNERIRLNLATPGD